ncbi:stabilizer of axonemal microtubules 1-like [Centruroides sculpturatus]|uniref:stabilizer of axonemal microtubules 1-like n=1 Tax=Centruroides sculpturatus TaxID=218467 RepID=UPI000C6E4739|nr:stabilizer of axonemal microtubules 1-like [Centruroides sculpturatus]
MKQYQRMKIKRCISNICICGRHHCPKKYSKDIIRPNPIPDSKLPSSEYIDKYEKFSTALPKTTQLPVKYTDQPMASETIASAAYKHHKIPPGKSYKSVSFIRSLPNLIGVSSYKEDYCNSYKKIPPAESYKPKEKYRANLNPLSDKTIHKDSYKLWKANDIVLCKGTAKKPVNSFPYVGKRPFVGITKYKEDYREFANVYPERGTCKDSTLNPEGHLFLDSTYKTDFVENPIYINMPERVEVEILKLPPFKNTTVYQTDFRKPVDVKQLKSYRPEDTYKVFGYPSYKRTVYKKDYEFWSPSDNRRNPWMEKEPYETFSQPFSGVSVYSESYQKPPLEFDRLPKRRPTNYMKLGDGKVMECAKCYGEDYENCQPKIPKLPEIYKTPRHKMLMESIYTTQYRGQFVPASKIMKPKENLKIREGAIADTTLYQDSYRCHPSTVCPSSLLHAVSPEGKPLFQHVGTTCGHEYYITNE